MNSKILLAFIYSFLQHKIKYYQNTLIRLLRVRSSLHKL